MKTAIPALLLLAMLAPARVDAQRAPIARRDTLEEGGARRYLVGEALLSSRTERTLRHLCDRIGPRPPGSREGREAEDWAWMQMREAGLASVRFQDFKMPAWSPTRLEAVAVGEEESRELHPAPLAHSATTPEGGLLAPLAEAGHCTSEEIRVRGDGVRDRAVLCRTGAPEGHRPVHRTEKAVLLARAGATAMVMASEEPWSLPVTGSVGPGRAAPLPAVAISHEEGEWLRRILAGDETDWILRLVVEATTAPTRARNIVGEMPGASREETILLGAHLDSWGPGTGAVDNGTGVAVLLEAARLLGDLAARQDWKPRRTVRFVLFGGEESGLHGSRAWVRKHRAALDETQAMINLDIVGEPVMLVAQGHKEVLPRLEETARRLEGVGLRGARLDVSLHSDHQPFVVAGVPAITLQSGLGREMAGSYHTSADTLDKIDLPALRRAAAVVAVLLYDLANAEELPHRRYGREENRGMLEHYGQMEILALEGWLDRPAP